MVALCQVRAHHVEPVYLLAMDNAGPTWSAGASVTGGHRVIPTAAGHTGLVYECSNDGTTEPTWPTDIGGGTILQEFANTLDGTDLIYRLLDGSAITDELPLTLPVPNGSVEDYTRWVTT